MCDPNGQRGRAAGARDQRLLPHLCRQRLHVLGRDDEAGLVQHIRGAGQSRGRRVHREVDAGIERTGGDQRHDTDERLHDHPAIPDHPRVGLARDHFGRRARGDERVETGDRTACDRDEREREQLAGKDGALARRGERRQRRHPERRQDDQDRESQYDHRGDLQEGREIVARAEQHPHGEHRGDEAVRDHHPRDRRAAMRERRRETRMARDAAARDQRNQQQQRADDRCFAHSSRAPALHPPTHEQRDRNRAGDREQPPRRSAQRVDHDQREHRQQNDHDCEHRDHRRHAGDFADFLFGHLTERLAITTQRAEQDRKILDRAAEHHADDEPQRPGEKSELRRQHGTHQRACSRDGREVVAKQHPAVRRHEVVTVIEALGGCGAAGIETKDAVGEKLRVEAVCDSVGADGGNQEPGGADRLAAGERQDAEGGGAECRDESPTENRQRPHAA